MSRRNRPTTLGDMQASRKPGKTHYQVIGRRDIPGAVVVGSDIFTAALSFTEQGRGALVVVADFSDKGRMFMGLRQRQDGKLETFEPSALNVVAREHPFILQMWNAWLVEKEQEKDNHAGNVLADTNVIAE